MSRESFLARVRQAAAVGRAYRVHLQSVPPGTGYVGASDDVCETLAREIDEVGGQAYLVDDLDAARQQLRQLIDEADTKAALCWQHELLDRLRVAELLAEKQLVRHDYDDLAQRDEKDRRLTILAAGIGISSVDCAIAETGTLMLCARPGRERVASLLPPLHVAIVERRQIVQDLFDAMGMLHERGLENLPSNVTFITGPSKTGDIELQLTTGVHGPGKWRVIIVR